MKHYIEVSGRGTGKSFRLVQKINSFLAENPGNSAALITPCARNWSRIKEKIDKSLIGNRLDCFAAEDLKDFDFLSYDYLFFDEFDFIGLNIDFAKKIIASRSKFCIFTSVNKQREISELDAENDPLVYLISENNGLYVTGNTTASPFSNKVINQELFESVSPQVIERELIANLFYRKNTEKQAASILYVVEDMANSRDNLGEYVYFAFEKVKDRSFDSFEEKVEATRRIACLAKYGKYSIDEATEIVLINP